ncbi:MAG: DUF2752 domain-containing protein [Clostridia bacterium]|nr:DUF2752 domain-containing protein [Clostridia bacterium]
MHRNINKIARSVFFAVTAFFYFIFGCPIRFLIGVSCPGCGMTRALAAVLRLDMKTALHYHPLIVVVPLFAILFFLFRKSQKRMVVLAYVLCAGLLAVYLWRFSADVSPDVVYFRPEEGVIFKIFRGIRSFIYGFIQNDSL